MSLLSTTLSEQIGDDLALIVEPQKGKGRPKKVPEKNKVIAACTGAIITSLTSTFSSHALHPISLARSVSRCSRARARGAPAGPAWCCTLDRSSRRAGASGAVQQTNLTRSDADAGCSQ